MAALRICLLLISASLMTGCYAYKVPENVDNVKSDIKLLKAYLRATPASLVCGPPGGEYGVICNYHLIVQHVERDLYQGRISDKAMKEGIQACKDFTDKIKNDPEYKGEEWLLNDYKCQDENKYHVVWYAFTIDGDKPKEGEPEYFHSVPRTNSLRKGIVEPPKTK